MPSDYDSAWKEALHRYFRPALELLFPVVADAVDWDCGYEFLDTELRQLSVLSAAPDRTADVLAKVTLRGGGEHWIIIHAEVQNQFDPDFGQRMYGYHYRLIDRYQRPACSLAILGDGNASWRPCYYETGVLGCKMRFEFPTVKLLDFSMDELRRNPNPLSLVVMAQLRANRAPFGSGERYQRLFAMVRELYARGLKGDEIRSLYELLDWVLKLTARQALQFQEELAHYEQELGEVHISSIQRLGLEEGLEKGMEQGLEQGLEQALLTVLETRFGAVTDDLRAQICNLDSPEILLKLTGTAATASTLSAL